MNRRLDLGSFHPITAAFACSARTVFFPFFPFSSRDFLLFLLFFSKTTNSNQRWRLILFTALAFPMCVSRSNESHLKPSSRGLYSYP
jgi:hypothetical protein